MLHFAICDDEPMVRVNLRAMLANTMDKLRLEYAVQEYACGNDLLAAYSHVPEAQKSIVILDIDMPGMNGIETAKKLRKTKAGADAAIIFVTALEEYMQDAFDVRAFNYLIKPVKAERFFDVVKIAAEQQQRLCGMDESFVMVKRAGSIQRVYCRGIIYIDCYNKKVTLHTQAGDIEYYAKMDELEKELGAGFFRLSRSAIIHFPYVAEYCANQLTLTDGTVLPIPRRQHSLFVKAFLNHVGAGGEVNV